MPTAKGKATAIMRQNADGTTKQIPVDVSKLLKGQLEDMVLVQNDVVFIPGSTTKTISRSLLGSLGNIVSTLILVGAVY